jgi:hypothetical protein
MRMDRNEGEEAGREVVRRIERKEGELVRRRMEKEREREVVRRMERKEGER